MSDGVSQAGPGASEARSREIVTRHAQGMDKLDEWHVPRMADERDSAGSLVELTIAERIELLAESLGHE